NSISTNHLVDIEWDSISNCLWIATWGKGLDQLNPETGKFKHYRHSLNDRTSIAGDNLWSLNLNKEGTLIIGSIGNGFSIYDREKDSFINYNAEDGLAEQNIVSILYDNEGILWLGSWGNGVERVNLSEDGRAIFDSLKGNQLKSVFDIIEDKEGIIWFSGSTGFTSYDKKTGKFTRYTTEDGLPGSMVDGALQDNNGFFWLSTNKGIVRFDPKEKIFQTFTENDGLPTNQFEANLLESADGKMYFSSGEGFVVFHPDSIKNNPVIPPVILTNFQIFNKPVTIRPDTPLKQQISITKEITLSYLQSVFSFEFTALNYSFPEKNQYAYKMEGFEEEWNLTEKRSATYTNLNPGTYTFRVKASNNDGIWNNEGIALKIHILPPWWKTWWFTMLVTCLSVGIIVTYYYYLKQQNKKLEKTVTDRTKELTIANNQINDKNKELVLTQEEINAQNEELQAANNELVQNQEEIASQRDQLSRQNQELLKAHKIIEEQNREITLHNQTLDLEVKERTKELLEYNQQLEQFAFIAGHNLRAPVARILGLGGLLKLEGIKPEEEKMIVGKMVLTTEELDQVVKDINTILEVKKSGIPEASEIDLSKQLEIIKANLEEDINYTEAKIISDFSMVNIIYSVKPYIDSILFNLIHNAIKYRNPEKSPVIRVKTEIYQDYICLTVSDNGLGINLENHKKNIFTLYKRFHTHVEGKGMGLYLVKTQVLSLGGNIEVDSKVNIGTTFKVFFKSQDGAK
ncbi:MAG TPA: triple tyrosine motif-containing protein, partial [Cytophagales bacterium]|nr:triple tyrosine motif-containing protein [Cytophagales bacterium]